MNETTNFFRSSLLGLGLLTASTSVTAGANELKNHYTPYPQVTNINEGISWPKGQALPIFASPAATLDTLSVRDLSKDEQLTFSALQGLVNRKQPRIYLQNPRAEEGVDTWPETSTANFGTRNRIPREGKYALVAKYAKELNGVVLYDPSVNLHYRNLAGTVAGLNRALPVTPAVYALMKENGVELEVVEDLTTLKHSTAIEIYQHMHATYWQKCEKRLIVSAKPHDVKGGGNYHHTRDIAVATGAAVVWLDTQIPAERELLGKFFGDMKAGEAIALGWYSSERSGITAASEYGIGTLPADFYVSASVFSGTDHKIRIPKVPKKPELANKIYVAIFISDGDNIQYTQHAMRRIWDGTAASRGKVPLNWTIAPGLVDIGPAIMNYYYTTATPNDCFVTGPSGMGYAMPSNTLTEHGAPVGEYLKDPARMDGYVRLTETYLQRSGLRVITIWDDASPAMRKTYEKHARNLYGVTVQNFKDVRAVAGSVENDRVRFDKLVIPYAGSYEHISRSLNREIRRWDGNSPLFLSYQVNIWGEMKPDKIVELHENLQRDHPDNVEFVRADHYFNLSNEFGGLPFNLCMSAETAVKSGDGTATDAVTDGTPETQWTCREKGMQWLGFDFNETYQLTRCVIRHAGDHGMSRSHNTRGFTVTASTDGKSWRTIGAFKSNTENVTDVDFPAVGARYVKITVNDPGGDSTARIADVEIYGRK